MGNITKINVGVDVSKNSLDIHLHPIGKSLKVENSSEGLDLLLKELAKYSIGTVAFEASGGYEQLLSDTIEKASYDCWRVRPDKIKWFIKGEGISFKTDKSDAKMIALFATKNEKDHKTLKPTAAENKIRALFRRKQELKRYITMEKNRLQNPSQKYFEKSILSLIKFLEKMLSSIEKNISRKMQKNKDLRRKAEIIESVPGLGKEAAQALIAEVPELGGIDNKKAAALLGTVPYSKESGKYKGKSRTKPGREIPKKIIYMGSLSASRFNPGLRIFYNRLIRNGKPAKVALVAVMRKLICLINTLLSEDRLWIKNV